MSSRPMRSASIAIPQRTASISPTRTARMSIEDTISVPFNNRNGTDAIPTRSYLSTRARVQVIQQTYEPRVVRATDAPCGTPTSSNAVPVSPVRTQPRINTRRSSLGSHPHQYSLSPVSPASLRHRLPSSGSSFPLPAYLNNSSLRNSLRTDPPLNLTRTAPKESVATSGGIRRLSRQHQQQQAMALSDSDSDDDSLRATSPAPYNAGSPGSLDETLESKELFLPTRWSDDMRHPSLSLSSDGKELSYHGPASPSERSACSARTNLPIPPACGVYYYEVRITTNGSKARISVGLACKDVKLARLPGWERNSWGYHGDDGFSYATDAKGTAFGPTFLVGDVIGCGIDFSQHRAFYTKNGALIGHVFSNVAAEGQALYPSVGLRHPGEAIAANFGQAPFRFDIEYHVSQRRAAVWSIIMNSAVRISDIASSSGSTETAAKDVNASNIKVLHKGKESAPRMPQVAIEESDEEEDPAKSGINQIVLDYLLHHGYVRTARAFQAQNTSGREAASACVTAAAVSTSHQNSSATRDKEGDIKMEEAPFSSSPRRSLLEDGSSIDTRTSIVHSVASGNIDSALTEIDQHYPSVLAADDGMIKFKLRCRKFVELTLATNEIKKRTESKSSTRSGADSAMDVDETASHPVPNGTGHGKRKEEHGIVATEVNGRAPSPAQAEYETALAATISYGQNLQTDYKMDGRPQVRNILKRTFGILAWGNLGDAVGEAAEVVGQEARIALATEINQAILVSQGHPARPALETLYRYTSASVKLLGLLGTGSAAFADMDKELLDA